MSVLLQFVMCLLAGFALWKLLRMFAREERLVRYLVVLGFCGRAIPGAILFWISWMQLPIARSLQLDYGLWFFALDGRKYFRAAAAAAEVGPGLILTYPRTGLSATYVQTLATFTYLFGSVASVALLLNLFCYVGTCLIVVRWLRAAPACRLPALVALAAITLSPAATLWSMAPLKDTLFQFLVVCIIAACAIWQRAWRDRPAAGPIVAAALVLITAVFAVTGIRWYFGLAVLLASGAFFILTAITSRHRMAAIAAGAATFFVLSQAIVSSAATYLPPQFRTALRPWQARPAGTANFSLASIGRDIRNARTGFEAAGGATSIGLGHVLEKIDHGRTVQPAAAPVTDQDWEKFSVSASTLPAPPAPPESDPPAAEQTTSSVDPPANTTGEPSPVAATPVSLEPEPAAASLPIAEPPSVVAAPVSVEPEPVKVPPRVTPPEPVKPAESPAPKLVIPEPEPVPVPVPVSTQAPAEPRVIAPIAAPPVVVKSEPAVTPARPPDPPSVESAAPPKPALPGPEPPAATVTNAETKAPPPPVPASTPAPAPTIVKVRRKPALRAAQRPVPAPAVLMPSPAPPTPVPAAPPPPEARAIVAPPAADPAAEHTIVVPNSTAGRVLAGGIAMLVPSVVTRELGLLKIGGGRGLWWFTDVDTILFDLVILFAIVFTMRRLRWATLRNPIFWFVLLVTVIGLPLVYTVTNYGTLFRLRIMIYVTFALLPLALSTAAVDETTSEDPREAPPENA